MLSVLLFVFVLASSPLATAEVNHCSARLLPSLAARPTAQLVLTKELADREYSVDSRFKSLHCCARGYLSIEWFKDGRAYPWPGDVSSFILYPESANQTVYTTSLRGSDAGNYTCRIHNYTDLIEHNTELRVFDEESSYTETPLATYRPPAISTAAEGSVARLFCEAFVGHIDLPDAASEVKWEKKGNATFEAPHIEVIDVKRESEIVGKYLLINNVDPSDFGTYYCTITNSGDRIIMETLLKPESGDDGGFCLSEQITIVLLVLTAPVAVGLLYALVRSIIANKLWNKVNEFSMFGGKKSGKLGLVILYSDGDRGFVDGPFQQAAREDASVLLILQKLSSQGPPPEEVMNLCSKIGKVVIILSKQLVPLWTKAGIEETLDKIIQADKQYSIVLLEALPEALAVSKKRLNVFEKSDPLLWSKLKEANMEVARSSRPFARLSSRLTGPRIMEVHV